MLIIFNVFILSGNDMHITT